MGGGDGENLVEEKEAGGVGGRLRSR
jgi:hypothetical protein